MKVFVVLKGKKGLVHGEIGITCKGLSLHRGTTGVSRDADFHFAVKVQLVRCSTGFIKDKGVEVEVVRSGGHIWLSVFEVNIKDVVGAFKLVEEVDVIISLSVVFGGAAVFGVPVETIWETLAELSIDGVAQSQCGRRSVLNSLIGVVSHDVEGEQAVPGISSAFDGTRCAESLNVNMCVGVDIGSVGVAAFDCEVLGSSKPELNVVATGSGVGDDG